MSARSPAAVRKALLLAPLLAGGCSDAGETPVPAQDAADRIDCALAGAADFTRTCWVERVQEGDTLFLVIRSDQGAFRRLEVLTDGRGVAAADGADGAQVQLADGGIEVRIANDRYRLPATMAASRASPANGQQQ